jgi:hypothetical protein
MKKAGIYLTPLFVMLLWAGAGFAQASKALEERTKSLQQGEKKSWQQVDEINRETDATKARQQQARQASTKKTPASGYSVQKKTVVTGKATKEVAPAKTTPGKKRK